MTEAELAERIAGQVQQEVKQQLGPFLDEFSQTLRGLREDTRRLRQENGAVLLKLAEIECRLGIDPAADEL
jgi:hypothetical protein